jgi:hypothetical protein
MEEKFGLIENVECKFVKTDPAIIESMSKRTGIPIEKMKSMLRYNMFTVNQFAQISQLAVSSVTNKTRPSINSDDGSWDTELDYCFPFRDKDQEGPKFVVRNAKSEKYIKL